MSGVPDADKFVAMPQGHQPMIMPISRTNLLWLLNKHLAETGQSELPQNTEITISVPTGGDYSGDLLYLDDDKLKLNARFYR